ncbi:hypothetical protein [Bartonella jaculi]|uniref:HTH cro/C1-type domain-containing protein n=1 Tax=Bartonella jaculi TaxID=686226 RepID=A0ABP9NB65_9HYPH
MSRTAFSKVLNGKAAISTLALRLEMAGVNANHVLGETCKNYNLAQALRYNQPKIYLFRSLMFVPLPYCGRVSYGLMALK